MAGGGNISEVIGLIPAAGEATRLGILPCSKEVYPIEIIQDDRNGQSKVKVAMHYVLEKMQRAGITKIFTIVNERKWDIPGYFKEGSMVGVSICYLVIASSQGVPFTLDQAYPFVKGTDIALGFPDILFKSDDAYVKILEKRRDTDADIVLGCFPVENKGKFDMVELDTTGRVRSIIIKPCMSELKFSWGIAVWSPRFTAFMHNYVAEFKKEHLGFTKGKEIHVGNIFKAALDRNFNIESVIFPDVFCRDIGTPKDLLAAIDEFNCI